MSPVSAGLYLQGITCICRVCCGLPGWCSLIPAQVKCRQIQVAAAAVHTAFEELSKIL